MMLPDWVPTGVAEDFSNTIPIGMDYTCPINKDKLWYELNLPGLPDVFFEQLDRFERGDLTKKDVRNAHKKFLRKQLKHAKRQ